MATRTRLHPYHRPAGNRSSRPMSKLIISNLHYEITEADVKKIFAPYGAFSRDPFIKYDRSGRSTGFAFLTYESEEDAAVAKDELDGVVAKGEKIHIKLDVASNRPPPKTEDSWEAPRPRETRSQGSLMNRIANAPLINRLSSAKQKEKEPELKKSGSGPVRSQRGGGAGRHERSAKPTRSKPKTAEDLDKELEAYVQNNERDDQVSGEDVDMAV